MAQSIFVGPTGNDPLRVLEEKLNALLGELFAEYPAAAAARTPLLMSVSSADGTVDPIPVTQAKLNAMLTALGVASGQSLIPLILDPTRADTGGISYGVSTQLTANVVQLANATPQILLSALQISESVASGTAVGTLSVVNHPAGNTGWTFTKTADPDSKFAVSGDSLNTAASLNYEVAASHAVTVTAAKSGQSNLARAFTISVTNVLEVTLAAITGTFTLSESAAVSAVAGAYAGKNSGSTLTLTSDAGGRVALSGGNIVRGATALDYESAASHTFTVQETHPDAGNSPRSTTLTLTVTDVDEAAPTLSSPTDAASGAVAGSLGVTTNEATGTLYWYVHTTASPPIAAALKAGTGAAAYGSQAVSGTGVQSATATGLTASTTYYSYFLHRDAAGNDSAVAAADGFTTGAAADVTPPVILSPGTASVQEGAVLSYNAMADEAVAWSLAGGADQARFELAGSVLRWLANGVKDYEAPNDADANNTYVVVLRATDGASNTTDKTVTVTVTNSTADDSVLATGAWNDNATWDDTQAWKDAA